MTKRLEGLAVILAFYQARLGGIQIAALHIEFNVGKVLRPIPEGTCFIQIGTGDFRNSVLIASLEPMKLYFAGGKLALCNQSLHRQE